MDYEKVAGTIEDFIREKASGFNGGVIGLSGGIDSTLVAYLTANAIGKERIHGLILPYFRNQDTDDGIEVAEIIGIGYELIDIKSVVDSFEATGHFKEKLSRGNLMARVRMCMLYGLANERKMIVIGTSNRSEIETGYFTKYGDGGVDIEPIGDLYKTEVWELAKSVKLKKSDRKIPEKIISKTPTAGLYHGQTDEAELGVDYRTLDKILMGEIKSVDSKKIARVRELVENSMHKRKLPPVLQIER